MKRVVTFTFVIEDPLVPLKPVVRENIEAVADLWYEHEPAEGQSHRHMLFAFQDEDGKTVGHGCVAIEFKEEPDKHEE